MLKSYGRTAYYSYSDGVIGNVPNRVCTIVDEVLAVTLELTYTNTQYPMMIVIHLFQGDL